ncbi:MAG: hypothetical protein HYT08_03285 [Candidatus Levybacteria bacterium]|nr:hypothetical protein [Candidatus Levybacteria bacterium]
MKKNKNIYSKPFIDKWPLPITFADIKECFKSENFSKKRRKKIDPQNGNEIWQIINQYLMA